MLSLIHKKCDKAITLGVIDKADVDLAKATTTSVQKLVHRLNFVLD
jgi:hypothetical protein